MLHHRSPEFSEKVRHVQDELGRLLQTHNDTLLFTCSGTGMMEAAVANLLSRGDKAICVNNGMFGERWVDICRAYGVEAIDVAIEWGKSITPDELANVAATHPDAKAVFVIHSETSTGALTPVDEIAKLAREAGALMLLDTVTSLGGAEVAVDKMGIDIVYSGTQKCLSCPPGLAPLRIRAAAMGVEVVAQM